jgi:hypothetical protein
VGAEVIEAGDGPGRAGPAGTEPEPEPHVGGAAWTRNQPTVAREAPPWGFVPQGDDRQIDVGVHVAALRESPQDGPGIHEPRRGGDRARSTVGADHDVGVEGAAVVEHDAEKATGVVVAASGHASPRALGTGADGSVAQPVVEPSPRDG